MRPTSGPTGRRARLLVPCPGGPAGDVDAYLKRDANGSHQVFQGCFTNGVPTAQARLLAPGRRPFAVTAGSEPSGSPAWKSLPSWAVAGTTDHVIVPAEQPAMARRAGAHVAEVKAGLLPLVTRPDAVTRVIGEAAGSVG
jgi:hypothetical protein